jgi:hypothetical protein
MNRIEMTEAEILKCKKDPLYYYNKYIRKPDQPKMTRRQFKRNVENFKKERDAQISQEELEKKRIETGAKLLEGVDVIELAHQKTKEDLKAAGITPPSEQGISI